MNERITNVEIQEFLTSFEKESETIILEEGKEKNELEKIAEARGIKIKGSRDLAIFKTIYAFTDKPNANGAILPKKELLKVLPQIVGKPININHDRRMVVGNYLDYRYKQKENQVIAYGTFFKSNFGEEFEEAKKLLKKKKLSSSFEIWSPKDKRKFRPNGSFEMHQMEIAGGALIYEDEENEPAFKDAKVLTMAKEKVEPELELVYASKHKEEELITSTGEVQIKDKQKRFITQEELRNYQEKKSTDTKVIVPSPIIQKIKCSNCSGELEHNGIDIKVKCPKCFAILNKDGVMQYPPQIKDFRLLCPGCKVNNWLIVSKKDDKAKVRCQSCAKEYDLTFATKKTNELINKTQFLYTGKVRCLQCHTTIYVSGTSAITARTVTCKKCGLEFSYDTTNERYKKISQIEEVIPKETKIDNKKESSEEGGQKMAKEKKVKKASEKKEDKVIKEFAKDFGKLVEKEMEKIKEEKAIEVEVETPKIEIKVEKKEEAKETPKAKEAPKTVEKIEEPKAEEKPEVKVEVKKEEQVEVTKEKVKEKPEATVEAKETPKAEEPKAKTITETAKEASEEASKEKADSVTKIEPKTDKKEVKVEEKKVKVTKKETPKEEKPIEARFEYEVDSLDEKLEDVKPAQIEESARLTTEQRNALPDSMFAVVVKVKDKRTGKTRKIRMYPINDEAHVRNALARLGQPRPKATLRRLGVSIESVKAKILRRARQLKMTQLLERQKQATKEKSNLVRRAVGRILDIKKTLRKAKTERDEFEKQVADLTKQVELYESSAKEIIKRREELGDYGKNMSDEDILNDDKFGKVKAEKENTILRAKTESDENEIVGSKVNTKSDEWYKKKRKAIDKVAFKKD